MTVQLKHVFAGPDTYQNSHMLEEPWVWEFGIAGVVNHTNRQTLGLLKIKSYSAQS